MSLTFHGIGQSWMIWTLYGAMVRPSGDSIYPRYLQEAAWNLHLSAQAKSPLVWSLQSTSQMWALCSNVVGINEDVIQIYDDYDVNHKSLKCGRCISKPFRHYQPLK